MMWKLYFHMIIINMESLRNSSQIDDMGGDGYNHRGKDIQLVWKGIRNYNNSKQQGDPN